jgi:hypothetical protein
VYQDYIKSFEIQTMISIYQTFFSAMTLLKCLTLVLTIFIEIFQRIRNSTKKTKRYFELHGLSKQNTPTHYTDREPAKEVSEYHQQ